ncbi:hypothetical protein MKW98_007982 [Papaver atlanticum]|uniref:Uncharacterized protein n=1 Tax=Papaver atlanticum TaxID=357466 RepID=A0AAD4S6R6_9MAGN|nr:hypothetical protein MKW98_007982 [Papaver atlanticum]
MFIILKQRLQGGISGKAVELRIFHFSLKSDAQAIFLRIFRARNLDGSGLIDAWLHHIFVIVGLILFL